MNERHRLILERSRHVQGADGTVPSPCVSVCRMDATNGLCEGCLRSLDEIAAWGSLDEAGRRRVWQQLAQRAGAMA